MLKGYKDKTCCNAKDCKQNNALCESEFSTLFLCIVSKMLTMALKAVPHSLPAKSSPIHKPCCKESEADKPLSGHRQLQALALSLLLQGTRMFLMFNKSQETNHLKILIQYVMSFNQRILKELPNLQELLNNLYLRIWLQCNVYAKMIGPQEW